MKQRLPDFAGVALVDILANGVGMLIIIIVLSISARFAQEEKQLEQVDDVSVVLSRQLATSIVLNTLSAAPPARLHDYEKSPLDQNLDFQRIPILELHREFVRDYYSGRTFVRKELLLEKNRLDEFLTRFTRRQKAGIRVDIYDIRQFYLAMSILRTHGIDPRHWHFITGGGMGAQDAGFCPGGTPGSECTGVGGGSGADLLAQQDLENLFSDGSGEGGGEDGADKGAAGAGSGAGEGEQGADAGGGGAEGEQAEGEAGETGGQDDETGQQSLPGETDLSSIAQGEAGSLMRFPASGALPQDGSGFGDSDSQGSPSDSQSLSGSHADLMQSIGRSSALQDSGQAGDVRPQQARFRRAVPEEERRKQEQQQGGDAAGQQTRKINELPPLRDILSILLDYMRRVQTELDEGRSPLLLLQSFSDDMEAQLKDPPPIQAEDEEMISALVEHFIAYWPDDSPPEVSQELRPQLPAAALALPPNTGMENLRMVGDAHQEKLPGLPGPRAVQVRINLYPSAFRGLLQNLELYSVMLIPPEQKRPEQFRWRAVTYIAPAFDDYVLGFVYAALDEEDGLLLQADANRIQVGQDFTRTVTLRKEFNVQDWIALFYALLVGALLLFLLPALLHWWRTHRPAPAV